MIIAIDGPAASGKGTLARRIARHYGLAYLDTGLLYRAVAAKVIEAGGDPGSQDRAVAAAKQLTLGDTRDTAALRQPGIGEAASVVAANPAVRKAILHLQREFAAGPSGAVLDGRDIGTVVCPDADVKLFVTASSEVRARRRHRELAQSGSALDEAEVLDQINQRDRRDSGRAVAPLEPAGDAHLLDTSELDIEAAFQAAVEIIDACTNRDARLRR